MHSLHAITVTIAYALLPAWSHADQSSAPARRIHSFPAHSFSKVHLVGGPLEVHLVETDRPPSLEIHAEERISNSIVVDLVPNDLLLVRMIETVSSPNTSQSSIVLRYSNLTELRLDGSMDVRCLNPIRTDRFLLHNRATGWVRLKLRVNTLDAYLHSIGRMKLCGQVNEEATLQALGVGELQCDRLFTKKINVISSGIGDIHVRATDEVNIVVTGVATVYFTGPLRRHVRTGLGRIVERFD